MERDQLGSTRSDEANGFSRREFIGVGLGAAGALALGGLGGGAAAAFAAPAAPAAKRGGTIKVAISDMSTKDSYDPQRNSSTLGLMTAGMMYDTLIKLDDHWNMKPMLATDWSAAKNSKEYTFKLRKGVEFHSGKAFEAKDVAYTFNRMLKGGAALHGAGIFGPFLDSKGIVIVDKYTIKFKLKAADGFFPIKLGFWYGRIIQSNANFKESMGTGPFKGKSYKGGQGFQLVRNENYWMDGLPYLDAINGLAVTDLATKVQGVVSGDTHFSDPGSFSSNAQITSSSKATLLENPYGFPYVMGINSAAKPYDDPNVRKAMKMLIDRKKYVQIVAQGAGLAKPDLFIHPDDPFFPKGLTAPAYDPEQAKALLKTAGYESGFKDTAWTAEFPGMPEMAVLFKSSMAEGGINMDVQNVSIDEWSKQLFNSNIVANYWGRQHPSTMATYMAKTGGQWNEDRLSDPKIDKWITEAAATSNLQKQLDIYHEIGTQYNGETACIWPFWSKNLWPHKKSLIGLATNPTDLVDFRRASLA
jgi:peptide/nickel transport system substrate-binding protein